MWCHQEQNGTKEEESMTRFYPPVKNRPLNKIYQHSCQNLKSAGGTATFFTFLSVEFVLKLLEISMFSTRRENLMDWTIFSEQADRFWNLVEKKSNEIEDGVFYLNQ